MLECDKIHNAKYHNRSIINGSDTTLCQITILTISRLYRWRIQFVNVLACILAAPNAVIYEAVANSVDQYLAGMASKVSVKVDDDIILISDDGAGLPFDRPAPILEYTNLAEYYLMVRHDYPTADNHAPHIHLIGGGLGLAVVNAASEYIKVTSSNGSSVWRQIFGKGKKITSLTKVLFDMPSGTQLEIKLDSEIFQGFTPDLFELRKNMFELAHFYPGLVVEYQEERFIAREGLLDLASIHYKNAPDAWGDNPPVKFFHEGLLDNVHMHIAAIGDTDEETEYLSWVNGCPSVKGGTHVDSLRSVFIMAGWNPRISADTCHYARSTICRTVKGCIKK